MKVLHLLTSGEIGGIETLCNEINNRSPWDNIFFFRKSGGIMYESIKASKSKIYENTEKRKFSIKTLIKLVKICKENQIDIINIHHEDVYLQIYYILLKKILKNTKFVWTVHSCFEEKYNLNSNAFKNTIIKFLFKNILKESDLLISVSNAVKRSYSEYFNINEDKFITVYNGTNMTTYLKEKNKNSNKIELIYIGRICEVKGIEYLIKAINILKEKNNSNIHLTIIGDGEDKEKYERLSEKLNLNQIIEFLRKKE